MNTYNLQCIVWDILSYNLKLEYTFFILCDFYSFQLLIKNLLKLFSITELFKKALKIVNIL